MQEVSKLVLRLCIVVLLLQIPIAAHAQFAFTTNSGTLTVTNYTGPGGAVIIPSVTNGLPVTGVGADAFRNLEGITSVTLPNSITNIGMAAFQSCYDLTNINIPGSVLSIGQYAVDTCDYLTTVTLGDGLTTIGSAMFGASSSLTSIVIPNSVTSIGDSAFYGSGMTNVVMSAHLTSIGASAFGFCENLRSAYFLGNAPSPGANAFQNAYQATAYYLPHTTGWSNTFAGIPTALWAPPLPTTGITAYSNQPVVILPYLAESIGTNFVIQMTTNVATGPWVTVTNGVVFVGLQITNAPSPAFFRIQ